MTNLSRKLFLLKKLYQAELGKSQEMHDYIRCTLKMVEQSGSIG